MLSTEIAIGRPGQFDEFERYCCDAMERAALRATSRAARSATTEIRSALPGRLGGAVGTGSDQEKRGAGVVRSDGFSASGWIHVRGRSERTLGAIISATEGGDIRARGSGWMAIATDEIPPRVGRHRMTPDLYRSTGLESSIGPLRFVRGRGSEALLVVDGPLTVDRFGRPGRARRLPRRGGLRPSRMVVPQIVAFVLIRVTSRTRRVDPSAIIAANAARMPQLVSDELRKETGHGRR